MFIKVLIRYVGKFGRANWKVAGRKFRTGIKNGAVLSGPDVPVPVLT